MATLEIQFRGDDGLRPIVQNISAEVNSLTQNFNTAKESGGGFFSHMLSSAGGFLASNIITNITGQVTNFIGSIGKVTEDQQDQLAQLQAGLDSTGGKAGVTIDMLKSLAQAQAEQTKFSVAQTEGIEKVALTFTSVNKDVFPQTIQLAEDMSQRLGIQGSAAMTMLGKAMDDPKQGMTALHRVGVSFTEDQKLQVKALMEMGDTMGAQKIILQELSNEYGGSATAAVQTFSGQQAILAHHMDDLKTKIGTVALPVLGELMGFVSTSLMPVFERFTDWFVAVLPGAIERAKAAIAPFVTSATTLIHLWKESGDAAGSFVERIGFVIDALRSGDKDALGPFQAGVRLLQTTITNAVTVISDLFSGRWTDATTKAMVGLDKLFGPEVMVRVTGAVELIRSVIERVRVAISNAFNDSEGPVHGFLTLFDQVSPTFELLHAAVEVALPPIRMIITDVFGAISGFLHEHSGKMLADVAGTWQQIQDTIHTIVPPIQVLINQVFGVIATFIHAHGDDIKGFLGQTWDQIASIIHTALELIQAIVPPILNLISGYISDHGTEIQRTITTVWGDIKAVIDGALTLIEGIIRIALDVVHGNWAQAWADLQTMSVRLVEDLVQIIFGGMDRLKGEFTEATQWITDKWNLLPSTLSDVGSAIVTTIQNGFESAWQGFKKSVTDKLAELRAQLPFSEPKDTSSPLYGLGKSGAAIVANLQGGINTAPPLQIGALRLAPALAGAGGAGSAASMSSSTQSTTINGGVNVYAAPGQNERQISRAVLRDVQRQIGLRR